MPYIGQAPAPKVVTSSDLADDVVTSAKIGDTAISGFSALGATPADTDEFLISDAGVLKRMDYSYIKGGVGYVHISTTNITSATANVQITSGIDSTYNSYLFVLTDVHPQDDNAPLEMQLSNDGGSSYVNSSYVHAHRGSLKNGNTLNHYNESDSVVDLSSNNNGNATHEMINVQFYLHKPSASEGYKFGNGHAVQMDQSGDMGQDVFGFVLPAAAAVDAVKFQFGSGNIDRGNFTLLGVANS